MSRMNLYRKISRDIGERGVVLGLFGFPFILLGISIISIPVERFSRPGPGGPIEFMDSPYWGYLWVVAGTFALLAMFLRPIYRRIDEFGYGVLILPPSLWALCYLISLLSFIITKGEYGRLQAYTGLFIFLNFVVLILYLARNMRDHNETRSERLNNTNGVDNDN